MKVKIDKKTDALYFRLADEKIIESEETSPGVILDYNENNEVVEIEILHLSRRTKKINLDSQLPPVFGLLLLSVPWTTAAADQIKIVSYQNTAKLLFP